MLWLIVCGRATYLINLIHVLNNVLFHYKTIHPNGGAIWAF